MMEVFLSILSVVVMSSPISIPFVLIIGPMLIDMFKHLKAAKWAEPPQWKIEYFGKTSRTRMASVDEIEKRYGLSSSKPRQYRQILNLQTTDVIREEVWDWLDWSSEKRFLSEKEAIKAFKKEGPYKDVPYVEFRAVCTFAGRSRDAARQAEIEAENAARLEYREHYIEHLEERLNELKRESQALPS